MGWVEAVVVGDFSAACGVDEDVWCAGAGVGLVVGGCAARVRFDAALLGFAAALVGAAVVVAGVVGGGVMVWCPAGRHQLVFFLWLLKGWIDVFNVAIQGLICGCSVVRWGGLV